MRFRWMTAFAAICLIAGCDRDAPVPRLDEAGPALDPIAFFAGHVRSWGVVESRSGAPTGWVVTDCEGKADGPDRLRMVQHLTFQHDPPQERVWMLWRTGPRRFEATASDMVGTAKGEAVGRGFHWQWILARSSGERPSNVTMDQWMYRLDDGAVMIRTTISKFGFILAEVSEQFEQAAPASVPAHLAGSAG